MPKIEDQINHLILKGFLGWTGISNEPLCMNFHTDKGKEGRLFPTLYPVRNNGPLGFESRETRDSNF
jgi:hypothetical protein